MKTNVVAKLIVIFLATAFWASIAEAISIDAHGPYEVAPGETVTFEFGVWSSDGWLEVTSIKWDFDGQEPPDWSWYGGSPYHPTLPYEFFTQSLGLTPGTYPISVEVSGGSGESPEHALSFTETASSSLTILFSPPPETLTIDTGFRPSIHGFPFANWGLIGDWYGHCVGMTFAAFNYFRIGIDPMSCPELINRLYIEWLQAKYLLDTVVQNAADALLQGQIPMNSTHVQTQYAVIRWALEHGLPCPILLAEREPRSHAVLAYKIKEMSFPDRTDHQVYIYDSVHPGDNSCQLAITDRNGTWEFDFYGEYERFVVINPLQIVASVYEMPLLYTLYSPVTLQITDPDGLTLDQHHCEFGGGYYRMLDIDDDGDEEELALILWPKEGEYLVNVIPDPCAGPNETYTLEEYKFGIKTVLADNVEIQNIPNEPYVSVALICATVDMQPDTLYVECDEYITAFIELPDDYSPAEIDANTIYIYTDDHFGAFAESFPCEIADYDSDGIADLMVEFDSNQVMQGLGDISDGNVVEFTLAGNLWDGIRFEGIDTVTIRLVDDIPPEITCPSDVTLEFPADTSVAANGSAIGTDTCGVVTITHSDSSEPGCGNTETITRTWMAMDECGNSSSCVQVITIVDTTAPVISDLNANYPLVAVGQTVNFSADIFDDCDDVVDTVWNFGDGTTSSSPNHEYGQAQIYTVTVTATDECGNVATDSIIIVVYDPTAGFTSGGGWFVPDNESFIDGVGVTDTVSKANFGFIVKYKKGADNPDGNLEFQYKAGDIDLKSQDMEWLVVQSTTKVRFKGKA
ncbi:MAG: PKD domain-containing protein, partial [Planctomycetota bacterium]